VRWPPGAMWTPTGIGLPGWGPAGGTTGWGVSSVAGSGVSSGVLCERAGFEDAEGFGGGDAVPAGPAVVKDVLEVGVQLAAYGLQFAGFAHLVGQAVGGAADQARQDWWKVPIRDASNSVAMFDSEPDSLCVCGMPSMDPSGLGCCHP
jgi:hypothetical protein